MRCFNHPDADAVGTCKQCNKGLCPDCAADLGHGLACRGLHEQEVASVHDLVSLNINATRSGRTRLNWFLVPIFNLFLGLVFAGFGLFGPRAPNVFFMIFGAGFLLFGVIQLGLNYRAWRVASTRA